MENQMEFKYDNSNFLAGVVYALNFVSNKYELDLNQMEELMEMAASSTLATPSNSKTFAPDQPQSSTITPDLNIFEIDEEEDLDDEQTNGNSVVVKWGATKEDMTRQLSDAGIDMDPDHIMDMSRTDFIGLRNSNGYNDAQKLLLSEVRRILRLRANEAKRRQERRAAKDRSDTPPIASNPKESQETTLNEEIMTKIGEHKPLTHEEMQEIIYQSGLEVTIEKLNQMSGWEFRKFKAACNEEQGLILGKFKRRLSAQKYAKRKKSLENGDLQDKRFKVENPTSASFDPTEHEDFDPTDIENRKLTNEEMQEVLTRAGIQLTVDELSDMDKLIMRNWWKKKKGSNKSPEEAVNDTNFNVDGIDPNTLLQLISQLSQAQNTD